MLKVFDHCYTVRSSGKTASGNLLPVRRLGAYKPLVDPDLVTDDDDVSVFESDCLRRAQEWGKCKQALPFKLHTKQFGPPGLPTAAN